jgi:hypothetical protein
MTDLNRGLVVAADQRFDFLDQVGRQLAGGGRVFLEELGQRRVAALDDGGGAAHGGEDLGIPLGDHALLRQRFCQNRLCLVGDLVQAPDADGSDDDGHQKRQGEAGGQARTDVEFDEIAHVLCN